MISASNSATKCLLMMLFEGGIPNAVAIVSPVNEGSKTTKPPCTPLSNFKIYIFFYFKRLMSSQVYFIL